VTSDVLRVAAIARKKTLGPFSPTFNITKILRGGLEEVSIATNIFMELCK
jgi:hypothetical protein